VFRTPAPLANGGSLTRPARGSVSPKCVIVAVAWALLAVANFREPRKGEVRRIYIPRTPLNRPEATLKPLDASRALRPTQGRSLLPPPIRPVPP
jgi:hypothetical protein